MHERQFALASLSARASSPDYLELHVRSKISVSEIQSFLLLKQVKCFTWDETG